MDYDYDDEPFDTDANDDWALASAGFGTDEDYGLMIGGDSDLMGEW